MTILGRYIAMAWLRLMGLCLGSFVAVYLVLDMMEKIPRFLRAAVPPAISCCFLSASCPR